MRARFTLVLINILMSLYLTRVQASQAEIKISNIYAKLIQVQNDIDLIRKKLNVRQEDKILFEVSNASTREVYFQALTLLDKVNRLSFERTRIQDPKTNNIKNSDIKIGDLDLIISETLTKVQNIKNKLGIEQATPKATIDESKNATDLYKAILKINRQVNLLLEEDFAPADVFQQVTKALSYASSIRLSLPNPKMQETPPYIEGKRPTDVFQRLVACFNIVERIAEINQLKILTLKPKPELNASPTDVYDLASLVVSELFYFYLQEKNPHKIYPEYYPGKKIPSDVFQRAGLLEEQLHSLESILEKGQELNG